MLLTFRKSAACEFCLPTRIRLNMHNCLDFNTRALENSMNYPLALCRQPHICPNLCPVPLEDEEFDLRCTSIKPPSSLTVLVSLLRHGAPPTVGGPLCKCWRELSSQTKTVTFRHLQILSLMAAHDPTRICCIWEYLRQQKQRSV